jgi:hypothetical protein
VTNCGTTSKVAIYVALFVATKTYVLVAKKMTLIMSLVARIVDMTIEYLWQFGRHNYHCKSDELYGH